MFKAIIATLSLLLLRAAPAHASIDETINSAVKPISDWALGVVFTKAPIMGHDIPLIIIWLLLISLFTTVYFKFINIRLFGQVIGLLGGKRHSEEGHGQISNWGALSTSLSGTVGLGNIAGVAVAISIGGPGATVWMILMGFFGMTTKFLECALGVKYRLIDDNGIASGGPMYYISKGFANRNMPALGKFLGIFFAICCIGGAFGGGNMFQSNQSYQMFLRMAGEASFFADKAWLFGSILAVLVGAVIIGGIQSIARVSSKIFPVMAGLYLIACFAILFSNMADVPAAIGNILNSAFAPVSVAGGILGTLVAGIQRATFSNESGVGSAAITYAAVKSDSHIAQGLIAMLNPFIDTVIICTMTALVIAVTGAYQGGGENVEGVVMTARAFATLGEWTIYWLGITVFLFAYSTLISWYYLGEKAFTYLCGRGKGDAYVTAFKIVYCLCIIVGCAANLANVIGFTDALFFAMAIPNVITLYMMAPEIKKDLENWLKEGNVRT